MAQVSLRTMTLDVTVVFVYKIYLLPVPVKNTKIPQRSFLQRSTAVYAHDSAEFSKRLPLVRN